MEGLTGFEGWGLEWGGHPYRMEQQGERQMEEVERIHNLTVPEVGGQDREVVRRWEGVVVQPQGLLLRCVVDPMP